MKLKTCVVPLAVLATGAVAQQTYTTTFDEGLDGWEPSNGTLLVTDAASGNKHSRSMA